MLLGQSRVVAVLGDKARDDKRPSNGGGNKGQDVVAENVEDRRAEVVEAGVVQQGSLLIAVHHDDVVAVARVRHGLDVSLTWKPPFQTTGTRKNSKTYGSLISAGHKLLQLFK